MVATVRALLAASPDLAAIAQVFGDPDTAIDGLAYDSRQVNPGGLFAAWQGGAFDGHRFIAAALDRGAVALLAERPIDDPRARCVVVVPNSRAALAQFAASFYRDPSL